MKKISMGMFGTAIQIYRGGAIYRIVVAVGLPSPMKKSITLKYLMLYQLKYKNYKALKLQYYPKDKLLSPPLHIYTFFDLRDPN